MEFPILENARLTILGETVVGGFSSRRKVLDRVKPHLDRLRLRFSSYDQPVNTLSGGNQQKVVLSKWLATRPRVLMLDEPTKGVDVGAKFEIHEIIRRQAASGLACLVVSSDLPEVLSLCHRVIVMREGRIQGELAGSAATEEAVMHLATHALEDAS
jgi:ABC-type sugar transport system ATPase subunit